MSRPKIILERTPDDYWDYCPFMHTNTKSCILCNGNRCECIDGPYYSETFDFEKCRHCTTIEKVLKKVLR